MSQNIKISLSPPCSPLQDAILGQLQSGMKTKLELSKALNRRAQAVSESLKSLIAKGKVKPEIVDETTYYRLSTSILFDDCAKTYKTI